MDTPSWRHILGGTAGVALLGAIGYFGQARIHTDNSPQKFTSKSFKSPKGKSLGDSVVVDSNSPANLALDGDFNMPPMAKRIKVDISGEIEKPGVYELDEGDRIQDLIKLAGGLRADADRGNVNLALKLKDEQKVIIPPKVAARLPGQFQAGTGSSSLSNSSALPSDSSSFTRGQPKSSKKQPPSKPVSINSATEMELEAIPGIGPSMAKRILDYRSTNGEFSQMDDLRKVKGMGGKLFDKIREWITL